MACQLSMTRSTKVRVFCATAAAHLSCGHVLAANAFGVAACMLSRHWFQIVEIFHSILHWPRELSMMQPSHSTYNIDNTLLTAMAQKATDICRLDLATVLWYLAWRRSSGNEREDTYYQLNRCRTRWWNDIMTGKSDHMTQPSDNYNRESHSHATANYLFEQAQQLMEADETQYALCIATAAIATENRGVMCQNINLVDLILHLGTNVLVAAIAGWLL